MFCDSQKCKQRRHSFAKDLDREPSLPATAAAAAIGIITWNDQLVRNIYNQRGFTVLGTDLGSPTGAEAHSAPEMKAELTCISEEGLADMDLPDNILEDFDYIGDCITSCNKVCSWVVLKLIWVFAISISLTLLIHFVFKGGELLDVERI